MEKGANVDLAEEVILLMISFFFPFFFFFFSLSHFSIFLNVKDGVTPLYIAAFQGYEQIIQILLKKGANVDLADQVILLIISFFFPFFFLFLFTFSFFYFFECKEWKNSSFDGCLERT